LGLVCATGASVVDGGNDLGGVFLIRLECVAVVGAVPVHRHAGAVTIQKSEHHFVFPDWFVTKNKS